MYFMKILKNASAGTMESSDVYVEIEPGKGIDIFVDSVVQGQFGENIHQVVQQVLQEHISLSRRNMNHTHCFM